MTRNKIFTYVSGKVTSAFPKAYTTSIYETTPKSFPCVMIRQIGKVRTTKNITLAYDDKQSLNTFEVQVVSTKKSGAQTEAFNIMETVESAFNDLYFIEDMCESLVEETSNYRLVARFHRQFGGGES